MISDNNISSTVSPSVETSHQSVLSLHYDGWTGLGCGATNLISSKLPSVNVKIQYGLTRQSSEGCKLESGQAQIINNSAAYIGGKLERLMI